MFLTYSGILLVLTPVNVHLSIPIYQNPHGHTFALLRRLLVSPCRGCGAQGLARCQVEVILVLPVVAQLLGGCCPAMLCYALLCSALPCLALPCPAPPRHPALPCSALLCPERPCSALLCPALPCSSLLCLVHYPNAGWFRGRGVECRLHNNIYTAWHARLISVFHACIICVATCCALVMSGVPSAHFPRRVPMPSTHLAYPPAPLLRVQIPITLLSRKA